MITGIVYLYLTCDVHPFAVYASKCLQNNEFALSAFSASNIGIAAWIHVNLISRLSDA